MEDKYKSIDECLEILEDLAGENGVDIVNESLINHLRCLKNRESQLKQKQSVIDECLEILDNVLYWETCPDNMKTQITKIKQLEGKNERI